MAIYDCTMFLNENDLYEIRLNQHWNFVDKFIVVEAEETHTGLPKPLNFDHKRFEPYAEKIQYVTFKSFDTEIPKYPELIDKSVIAEIGPAHNIVDWTRDHFQFNYFYKILQDQGADDNDVVYFSCLDEIIKESAFDQCVNIINETPWLGDMNPIFSFNLYLYAYKINLLHRHWTQHYAANLTTFRNFRKYLPETIRQRVRTHTIPDAGWHFTFLDPTDGELVLAKQRSWAHSKDVYPGKKIKFDHITKEEALARFWEDYDVTKVDVAADTHPEYIMENLDRFQNFIFHGEKPV